MSTRKVMISIETALLDRLDKAARANFCSRSDYIRVVLVKNLGERDTQKTALSLKQQIDGLDLTLYKTPPSKETLNNFLAKHGVTRISRGKIGFEAVYRPEISEYGKSMCETAFSELFGELVFLSNLE